MCIIIFVYLVPTYKLLIFKFFMVLGIPVLKYRVYGTMHMVYEICNHIAQWLCMRLTIDYNH